MPALPLDEAGKYVAAAYVVFVALILAYVAIMAAKLERIDRELSELTDLAEEKSTRASDGVAGRRLNLPPRWRPTRRKLPQATPADESRGFRRRCSLMSELLALGISHKTAPLELRERVAFTEGRAAGMIRELVEAPEVHEAAAISTCNRTELYLVAPDGVAAESLALGVLAREAEIRPTELVGHLYSLRATDAASHMFRVTAGLDSMIIGEAEIQGQVKRAYELALVEGATGPILNRLFRGALAAGKRARSETRISEKGVSVPSVAVELAQRALGDLSSRLVLGGGRR